MQVQLDYDDELLSESRQIELSTVKIRLLKGAVYKNKHKQLWECLEREQMHIRNYFQQIGLNLFFHESEGFAFLKQSNADNISENNPDNKNEYLEIPRLISRRQLSFPQTLLLVLLRKRLAEHDSEESDIRLLVTKPEIYQWLQPYFPEVSNELKQQRDFDALIKKMIEMSVLSSIPNSQDEFELQRIIIALVNADQITELLDKFVHYSQSEK